MFTHAMALYAGGTVVDDSHTAGAVDALRFDAAGTTGNVFLTEMPSTPDVAVLFIGNGGQVEPSMDPWASPAVQAIIRGAADGFTAGQDLAQAVLDAFDILDRVTLAAGTDHEVYVHGITAMQSAPIYLGVDENRRPEWSVNFDCSIHRPTTNRPAA